MRRHITAGLTVLAVAAAAPATAFAASASVLPRGVWSLDTTFYSYFDIDERYNENGDKEELAVNYNGDLSSGIFPDLALVEAGFGLGAGTATIGASEVDYTLKAKTMEAALQYGVTDRFMLKLVVPYLRYKNVVTANLNASHATVGKNSLNGTGFDPFFGTAPLMPSDPAVLAGLGLGGYPVTPITTADVQNLLGAGLDVDGDGTIDIAGYGLQPVQTWSGSGLGDITFSGKYQLYKKEGWQCAFSGGLAFPTGEEDDSDNLADLGFGKGAYTVMSELHGDYRFNDNVSVGANVSYDWILPTHAVKRVPLSVDQPIAPAENKEEVRIDYGDSYGFDIWSDFSYNDQLSLTLKYALSRTLRDRVEGSRGLNYESLMDETRAMSQSYVVTMAYSTVQFYLDKKFAIPFQAAISYRNRFAGKNNVNVSEYLGFNLTLYWK